MIWDDCDAIIAQSNNPSDPIHLAVPVTYYQHYNLTIYVAFMLVKNVAYNGPSLQRQTD